MERVFGDQRIQKRTFNSSRVVVILSTVHGFQMNQSRSKKSDIRFEFFSISFSWKIIFYIILNIEYSIFSNEREKNYMEHAFKNSK